MSNKQLKELRAWIAKEHPEWDKEQVAFALSLTSLPAKERNAIIKTVEWLANKYPEMVGRQ